MRRAIRSTVDERAVADEWIRPDEQLRRTSGSTLRQRNRAAGARTDARGAAAVLAGFGQEAAEAELWSIRRSSARDPRGASQARPAAPVAQPGHVHRRDRRGHHHSHPDRQPRRHGDDQTWFVAWITALALVHRPLRQLRRGDGRRARQGPGRHAAQDPNRDDGQGAGRRRPRPSSSCAPRPSCGPATSSWSKRAT